MIKSQFLFVTKDEQTLYSFQRMVRAFKTGVHSVTKSFKAQSTHKTVFCYDLKTINRLNVESIDCFGLTASQPPKTVFNLFQNT